MDETRPGLNALGFAARCHWPSRPAPFDRRTQVSPARCVGLSKYGLLFVLLVTGACAEPPSQDLGNSGFQIDPASASTSTVALDTLSDQQIMSLVDPESNYSVDERGVQALTMSPRLTDDGLAIGATYRWPQEVAYYLENQASRWGLGVIAGARYLGDVESYLEDYASVDYEPDVANPTWAARSGRVVLGQIVLYEVMRRSVAARLWVAQGLVQAPTSMTVDFRWSGEVRGTSPPQLLLQLPPLIWEPSDLERLNTVTEHRYFSHLLLEEVAEAHAIIQAFDTSFRDDGDVMEALASAEFDREFRALHYIDRKGLVNDAYLPHLVRIYQRNNYWEYPLLARIFFRFGERALPPLIDILSGMPRLNEVRIFSDMPGFALDRLRLIFVSIGEPSRTYLESALEHERNDVQRFVRSILQSF